MTAIAWWTSFSNLLTCRAILRSCLLLCFSLHAAAPSVRALLLLVLLAGGAVAAAVALVYDRVLRNGVLALIVGLAVACSRRHCLIFSAGWLLSVSGTLLGDRGSTPGATYMCSLGCYGSSLVIARVWRRSLLSFPGGTLGAGGVFCTLGAAMVLDLDLALVVVSLGGCTELLSPQVAGAGASCRLRYCCPFS